MRGVGSGAGMGATLEGSSYTSGGPRCQFMSGFGREVGIAGTTKHAQVLR
jgi:hypothetical protein